MRIIINGIVIEPDQQRVLRHIEGHLGARAKQAGIEIVFEGIRQDRPCVTLENVRSENIPRMVDIVQAGISDAGFIRPVVQVA